MVRTPQICRSIYMDSRNDVFYLKYGHSPRVAAALIPLGILEADKFDEDQTDFSTIIE